MPPQSHLKDLELIDYRQDHAVIRSLQVTRELFGEDIEIYAVGFSLGSNALLRHLGSHKDCQATCGIKAAVSISGAFDIPSVTVDLQNVSFGLFNRYILTKFQTCFGEHRFKIQNDDPQLFTEGCQTASTLYEFESMTRAKALNLSSSAKLLR